MVAPDVSLALPPAAMDIYEPVRDLPIVSPHGHCDPAWFAEDRPFSDPAELLIIPDHYVFRMLYSQGIALEDLGVGVPATDRDPRKIFQVFADHFHLFRGTPSHLWLAHTFAHQFGIGERLTSGNAMAIYDAIDAALKTDTFRPRVLFETFGIEVLATTDGALDDLGHHKAVKESGWGGRIVPTFRPDNVLDPSATGFQANVIALGAMTNEDTGSFDGYLAALRKRRAEFRALGATATDHAITDLTTDVLSQQDVEALFARSLRGDLDANEATRFYGHMLVEMAEMSRDDGMVMQIHAGAQRSTNASVLKAFGADKGADIPKRTDWVGGLRGLLNRVGNDANCTVIAFTLDETTYTRELAPMAGHWPALRLGPPWWFHDSANGIARYLDQTVETAGYHNLAGFNDDTRAFLSIPARHDLWRRVVSLHLAEQVTRGVLTTADAHDLARLLSVDLARDVYRLGTA